MVTAPNKNIKHNNKKTKQKELKSSQPNKQNFVLCKNIRQQQKNASLSVPNCCYTKEEASKYYTLPKGYLTATTIK